MLAGPQNIIFLHPDLGVGGAERLVVDCALALLESGHQIKFITSYHSKDHCFEETKNGTFDVEVIGGWIPRNFLGKFFALFAYIKMIYCALYIIFFSPADIVICDLVSVCIPILKLRIPNVIFYCHFPDQLLSKPEGRLKSLYRMPLNWLEEKTTNMADKIYVNSKFTQKVFADTFKSIKKIPDVLHPSINTSIFDKNSKQPLPNDMLLLIDENDFVFLSINRYERKKEIDLAIKAFRLMKKDISVSAWNRSKLVIAGGYDSRISENVQYYSYLENLVDELTLGVKVILLKSISDVQKVSLLARTNCLIYTPRNEHFGIVPLEAMYMKTPVIASSSGGPKETVVHGETGFLCEQSPDSFAECMSKLLITPSLAANLGMNGHKRFIREFSFEAFSKRLQFDIDNIWSKNT